MMKRIIFESDNSALNDTLCDGLARRIFREAREHAINGAISLGNPMKDDNGIAFAKDAVNRASCAGRLKKMAKKAIVEFQAQMFISALLSPYRRLSDNGQMTCMDAIAVKDNLLYSATLIIDTKKPHKSGVHHYNIGFTVHAVARLIRRAKPEDVIRLILMASSLCHVLIETFTDLENLRADDGKYWFPIYGLGYFLMAKSDEQWTVVTFVDANKLTEEQVVLTHKVDLFFENEIEDWRRFKEANIVGIESITNKPKMIFQAYFSR